MDYAKVVKEIEEGIMFAESRGYEGLANTMRNAIALIKKQKKEISLMEYEDEPDFSGLNDDFECKFSESW